MSVMVRGFEQGLDLRRGAARVLAASVDEERAHRGPAGHAGDVARVRDKRPVLRRGRELVHAAKVVTLGATLPRGLD